MLRNIFLSCIAVGTITGVIAAEFVFAQTEKYAPLIPQDMAYVSEGTFTMGINKEVKKKISKQTLYDRRMATPMSREAFHDEGPAHEVRLDAYLIDKYETSNKDFTDFIKTTGHPAPAYWDDPRLNKPELPVVGVNWQDAKAFCEWKGKRLPTEAEWEKAARGPQANLYPWGNDFDSTKAIYGKIKESTVPVNSFPESASYYGLHHMAGNVFEWVNDWYDPSYYEKLLGKEVVNPNGPEKAVWIGGTGTYVDRLTVGEKRVIRGGSWIAPEGSLRTTHRFWNHPLNNSYGVGLGFRCAMNASSRIQEAISEFYIMAMVSMGKENFKEAEERAALGLALDPSDARLKNLMGTIKKQTHN